MASSEVEPSQAWHVDAQDRRAAPPALTPISPPAGLPGPASKPLQQPAAGPPSAGGRAPAREVQLLALECSTGGAAAAGVEHRSAAAGGRAREVQLLALRSVLCMRRRGAPEVSAVRDTHSSCFL